MSRVSCDSFVFGAKCVTVVIFRSLEVACAVARVVFSRVSCDSFVFGAKCETVGKYENNFLSGCHIHIYVCAYIYVYVWDVYIGCG